jgi:hypothetical protein
MDPSTAQQSGIAGIESSNQPAALMGQIRQNTLLRAPASILQNLKNKNISAISGHQPSKPKLQVPEVVSCRGRLDSTASQSVISTRDDTSEMACVQTTNYVSAQCQKSMNSFIREPPQPGRDPCFRILQPSSDQDLNFHEDIKSRSYVEISSSKLLSIPPKVRSYEEPAKKQIQIPTIEANIRNCMNCEGRFREKTMRLGGKLCANCYKIHESVSRTVRQFGGSFDLVVKRPGQVELILCCGQGHTWTIGMQSRKAKNGCRQCKDQSRVENARRQFEEQARLREEQER